MSCYAFWGRDCSIHCEVKFFFYLFCCTDLEMMWLSFCVAMVWSAMLIVVVVVVVQQAFRFVLQGLFA